MKVTWLLLIAIIGYACTNPRGQEIIVPELHSGFYSEALNQINSRLKSDPSNTNLIEQKLYYCDQLDWPTTCITALNEYRIKFGMTNQLVEEYIKYYERHGRYQLLIDVIEKWSQEYDLEEKFHKPLIISLVNVGNATRAKYELRNFLIENQSAKDLTFASKQYLQLRDTAMAVYNLTKLFKVDPGNDIMLEYGTLLVSLGYPSKGFSILEDHYTSINEDEFTALKIARLYEGQHLFTKAREKLKPFIEKDTVAYLIADWYKREFLWDSAIMYIDSVIYRDSTNTKAWWKRGRMYEDKGWLSYSLKFFENILEIDPADSMAIDRIALIQRKIAYLQRQKFEESKVPVLELEPIKIKNE